MGMRMSEAKQALHAAVPITTSRRRRTMILGGLCLLGMATAEALKPRLLLARARAGYDYDMLIPATLPGWAGVELQQGQIVDPNLAETVKRFYSQTVTRAYVAPDRQLLMLSLAYGKVQNDQMRVHLPEVCYAAQGFDVTMLGERSLPLAGFVVPIDRVAATQGSRSEMVSYFVKVGDTLVGRGLQRKLAQMRYSLRGIIPDGLLVRVSSIGLDAEEAFDLHRRFFAGLYAVSSAKGRQAIFGRPVT